MNTYRACIYRNYNEQDLCVLEQPRKSLGKDFLQNVLSCLIDCSESSAATILYYIIYRNDTPIVYGSFDTFVDHYLPSHVLGQLWLSRWDHEAGEYTKRIVIAD